MAAMARVFRTAFANKLSRFSSSASVKEAEIVGGSRRLGLEILGAKDYEDYKKSRYGEITHKALLVDAVGTLLVPAQPMAQEDREKYGVEYAEDEILNRYLS